MALLAQSAASWSNSGQAFQILDQPDHRQRIPVTVVEQVSPDSVSFVLGNLGHDEEEPGDFDASLGRTRTGSVQDVALPKTMDSNFGNAVPSPSRRSPGSAKTCSEELLGRGASPRLVT